MMEEGKGLERLVGKRTTRRGFMKLGASAGVSLAAVSAFPGMLSAAGFSKSAGMVILSNAKGMLLADPTRCVGCRRCETSCTEFNEGKSQPSIARVKVGRNYNYGMEGPWSGGRGDGMFGNLLMEPETCKQCPHPVPCATACQQGAIYADPATGARVVDPEKCIGCKLCVGACPWQMIMVDPESGKATKCFNCGECVSACPTGALRFVAWRDLTKEAAPRVAAFKLTSDPARDCGPCHSR
jgi:Fe-S-cluster-containing dehydrogenase component